MNWVLKYIDNTFGIQQRQKTSTWIDVWKLTKKKKRKKKEIKIKSQESDISKSIPEVKNI